MLSIKYNIKYNIMQRSGYKWNVNECLKLQREYELLNLPIRKIADLHKRTSAAIISKLVKEGFCSYNDFESENKFNCLKNLESDIDEDAYSDADTVIDSDIDENEKICDTIITPSVTESSIFYSKIIDISNIIENIQKQINVIYNFIIQNNINNNKNKFYYK